MQVMCKKKGVVATGICGNTCNDFEHPKEDDPWGNPPGTCANFRYIIRSPKEQAEMGVHITYPGQPGFEKKSKKIAENEDRDTDHISKKTFPIFEDIRNLKKEIKFKPRKLV